jgi:hypothetical protein
MEGLLSMPARGTLRKFTFTIPVEHELQPELKDIILTLRSFPKLAYIQLPLSVSDLGIRSNFPDPLLTAQPYHLDGSSLGQCSSLYSLNVHIVANQYAITLLRSLLSTAVLAALQHLTFTFDICHNRQLVFYPFTQKRPHAGSEALKPILKTHVLNQVSTFTHVRLQVRNPG